MLTQLDSSKYITDNLRPNQFTSNQAYIDQRNAINKQEQQQSNMQRTPTTDTEDDISEEQMDEYDGFLRPDMLVSERTPSVFCCGEQERPLPKVVKLHLSRNSPGQAVQVITMENSSAGNGNHLEASGERVESQAKKLKISKIQDV